jgi:hypothetical protein
MIALDLLLDRLPEGLVDEAATKRLRLIGDRLPDALAGRVGLEARLNSDPRVDLLLLVAERRQLAVLADLDASVRLAEDLRGHPAWRAAGRLARRSLEAWDSGPVPPGIWLEFDAQADVAIPVPGLFTAAAPDGAAGARWDAPGTISEILHTVGAAPSAELARQVRRIAEHGLRIRQVGFFAARPGLPVRLFCTLDDPHLLPAALTECGWRAPADPLRHWLAVCTHAADTVHVSMDVGASGVLPGVGIEVAMHRAAQPRAESRWAALFDTLSGAGVGVKVRLQALQQLGRTYEAWMITRRRYHQGLHHIKVTIAADGGVSAKAYFGAYEVTAHNAGAAG